MPASVRSRPVSSAATTPSLMIATRSQWAPISPSRWLTSITTRPRSARSCIAAKSSIGLVLGQRRVRLVEEEEAGVDGEGACDLDSLPNRQRAFREQAIRVRLDGQLAKDGQVIARVAREGHPRHLASHGHVLGHREIRPELGFLVHDRHTVARVARLPGRAVDQDLARVSCLLAGQDPDQRALARAVGAGDPQDLASNGYPGPRPGALVSPRTTCGSRAAPSGCPAWKSHPQAPRNRRRRSLRRQLRAFGGLLAEDVHRHGPDRDHADEDELRERADTHDGQTVA